MNKLSGKHDEFFKQWMSDIAIAREFLRQFLPEQVVKKLDLDSLRLGDFSFVDENLKSAFAGLVNSCKLNGVDGEVFISILVEHKSDIDHLVPVQLLYYMSSAYYKQIKQGQTLRLIIPVLFYHGNKPWPYQRLSGLFSEKYAELFNFLPDFDYIYNNLQALSDEQLMNLANQFLVAALLAMKHSKESDWLERNVVFIIKQALASDRNLKRSVFVDLFSQIKPTDTIMKAIGKELERPEQEEFYSMYDWLIDQGIEKGFEKGIIETALNLRELGIPIEVISQATKLSIAQLEQIFKDAGL